MENMARSDYGSPQNILELETMYDSSLEDADDKLFSTLTAQPSLDGTDMSSVADENWYEDAIPWNHYMTQSRGQNQASDAVEPRLRRVTIIRKSTKKMDTTLVASRIAKLTRNKEDTEATADENRNLLANTVKSYITK